MSQRVLLIGKWWQGSSGVYRRPGLDKYLPEFGWEPVVLGWPLPAGIELPHRVVPIGVGLRETGGGSVVGMGHDGSVRRKVARRLGISPENPLLKWSWVRAREVLEYPDEYRKWRCSAMPRAVALVRDEHFDAVISTSTPISTHLVAAKLKREFGLTWIADFPHLWSQDHGVPYGRVRRWFDRRLEVRTLAAADVLTTIIGPLAEQLESLHGEGRVVAIEHGFDPEMLNTEPARVTPEFTITYTGGWSPGVREPRMVLNVIRKSIDEGSIDRSRVHLRFYGPAESWVQAQIQAAGLSDLVRQYGSVAQTEVFARQRESQVLLIPKAETAAEGMISSKFYEYLAARRPILAIGGHSDIVNEKLQETHAGVSCESLDQAAAALTRYYDEYRTAGGVQCCSDLDAVMRYSHREMAAKFAKLLDAAKNWQARQSEPAVGRGT